MADETTAPEVTAEVASPKGMTKAKVPVVADAPAEAPAADTSSQIDMNDSSF